MIRSRPWKEWDTMRERVREQRLRALHSRHPVRRRIAAVVDGRLLQGTDTLHRTPAARRWRTCIRLIQQRARSPR